MNRPFGKREKVQISLLTLACVIVVLGLLFLVNAMQEDPANGFFPAFCEMDNILAKYIIVILTMACGIMLFSNVAVTIEDRKLRNGLTIGVTTFSTVLTVPLVYVFIALLPYAASPVPFEKLGAIDAIMRTDRIYEGFVAWFRDGAFMWVVLVFMLLLSIVFITFPLVTGILAVKSPSSRVSARKPKPPQRQPPKRAARAGSRARERKESLPPPERRAKRQRTSSLTKIELPKKSDPNA